MKQRFWLFKRRLVYYLQDSETGKKDSLGTRNLKQAERLRAAKNEAAEKPLLGLTLGKAYLSAYDPKLVERKWALALKQARYKPRVAGADFLRANSLGRSWMTPSRAANRRSCDQKSLSGSKTLLFRPARTHLSFSGVKDLGGWWMVNNF